jgi:Bcr/CflA subfamily drug resistance transporter
VDIYTPSLPAMSHYFHVDHAFAQWSITAYLLGLGFFQLIAGAISDSFGRRLPTLVALAAFTLLSLATLLVHSINLVIFLRFLQGAAVAITIVPLRAIFSDLFEGKDYIKMISYMTIVWSMGPIVAPAIGGYLQHYFNWQANFVFLTIYGITTFTLFYYLVDETSLYRHDFSLCSILRRSLSIMKSIPFIEGVLINGMLYSIILIFATMAPFILQNTLHYTPQQYGKMALLAGLFWLIGTLINRATLHFSMMKKIRWALHATVLLALGLLLLTVTCQLSIATFLVPTLLVLLTSAIVFPNYFACSIALFPKISGSASALYGCAISTFAGLSSGLASLASTHSALPFSIIIASLTVSTLVVFYIVNNLNEVLNHG